MWSLNCPWRCHKSYQSISYFTTSIWKGWKFGDGYGYSKSPHCCHQLWVSRDLKKCWSTHVDAFYDRFPWRSSITKLSRSARWSHCKDPVCAQGDASGSRRRRASRLALSWLSKRWLISLRRTEVRAFLYSSFQVLAYCLRQTVSCPLIGCVVKCATTMNTHFLGCGRLESSCWLYFLVRTGRGWVQVVRNVGGSS